MSEVEDNLIMGPVWKWGSLNGLPLAYWASGVERSGPLEFVEWSSSKHNGVKLLERSSKVEWSLWSRAIF